MLLDTLGTDYATVFSKLASQLTADRLVDLAVIPVIFIVQTLVSWMCSLLISKFCKFNKRQSNFVTAMGVCGSSFVLLARD